ncbi:MAG TPA: MerR family transcriptional regulator [Candidatus Latescibacteria bacterium]|nr:MerR family transcriptional regulator [Candidatus Latescibacterota bacterium]
MAKLYYSIGEVSRLTGVKPHILRFWEEEFSILRPRKNRAGNRVYRSRDIKIVLLLKRLLHEEKYTIEAAKEKLLDDKEFVQEQLKSSSEEIESRYLISEIREDLKRLLKLVDEL